MINNAYEILGNANYQGRLLLTCEHASNRIPPPLTPSDNDMKWLESHWGWDVGAAEIARELVLLKDCEAVLASFSRLICDPNRPLDHKDMIRLTIEGEVLSFNRLIDQEELSRRTEEYWGAFHEAVETALEERSARGGDIVLLSIHTFTPKLGDETREMEVGVLYDTDEAVGRRLATQLVQQGFVTALNEPYSGREGLMFSVARHGKAHGLIALLLEVRQDLVDTPQKARMVARRLEPAISHLQVRSQRR